MSFLSIEHVSKKFGDYKANDDISLSIQQGKIFGLLGPNGAGKTTSFYMIVGLIKPNQGIIKLDDHDITKMPMYRRAQNGIGYLPQEPSIFRGLSVKDNILAVLETVESNESVRQDKMEELLRELNIERLKNQPSPTLSGGERRRLEIARALATDPKYILLDEPFAGVDPISVIDIKQIILHLRNRGIGVLITDHNVRETLGICDRAYIINDGGVLADGKPDEIVYNENVRKVYLGENFRL